ncbi:unnamed protein product [Pleuronectes platessa]|uniref:Uncharacterized protein n=1 Tax=Pleuronectes platessa TaxID=8262 RepID=A0A9N7VPK5_PLEPL|nr:unnamed protein product [Pleuronectes platessa]
MQPFHLRYKVTSSFARACDLLDHLVPRAVDSTDFQLPLCLWTLDIRLLSTGPLRLTESQKTAPIPGPEMQSTPSVRLPRIPCSYQLLQDEKLSIQQPQRKKTMPPLLLVSMGPIFTQNQLPPPIDTPPGGIDCVDWLFAPESACVRSGSRFTPGLRWELRHGKDTALQTPLGHGSAQQPPTARLNAKRASPELPAVCPFYSSLASSLHLRAESPRGSRASTSPCGSVCRPAPTTAVPLRVETKAHEWCSKRAPRMLQQCTPPTPGAPRRRV